MYELVLTKLEARGFAHYEVSNWAWQGPEPKPQNHTATPQTQPQHPTPDYRCRHNLAYWHNHDWLGLGPSAASHLQGHRWRNAPNLTRYLQDAPRPPIADHEHLAPQHQLGERLMLGLRLREGVDAGWLLNHPDLRPYQREAIDEAAGLGLLEQTHNRLRLTRKGLFVADSVIAQVL